MGLDDKLRVKMALVLSYYMKHFKGLADGRIHLLTADSASKKLYHEILDSPLLKAHLAPVDVSSAKAQVMSLNEYVQMYRKEKPELANFEGFLDEAQSDVDFMSQDGGN